MNYNIPDDLMNNVEKNLRKHIKNKTRKKYIYKMTAAIISLLTILPASTLAFAKYNSSIQHKQEIDLARKNKNITEVNKIFKYNNVQFTIKEILADDTGIEVIYDVSNPKYSINKISFCDKDNKEFTKDLGYLSGYTLPNLNSTDKEKSFGICFNNNTANYIKNNPVSININNLVVSDKKSENIIDKVSSLIDDSSNIKVDWTLKMQIPMQQVKVIPVNKEYSLDIGTLKINSFKVSIFKNILDYTFVPKDRNIGEIQPLFSVRLGNEYVMDQGGGGEYNSEDGSSIGTQTFNSIYYKDLNQIGIKLIGIRANYKSNNSNLYKIDKNNLPMEFDFNGEKFKITSAGQKGDSTEYTIEYNKTDRIYNELDFDFPGVNSSRLTNNRETIKFKDQTSRDSIYSSLTKTVPNLKDIEHQFGNFQTGAVGATVTTTSNKTEFRVSAVKNIIYNEDEVVIHK